MVDEMDLNPPWSYNYGDNWFYFTDKDGKETGYSYPEVVDVLNHLEKSNIKLLLIGDYINSKLKELNNDLQKSVKAGMPNEYTSGTMWSEIELLEELKEII